jgi:hypothetical protein
LLKTQIISGLVAVTLVAFVIACGGGDDDSPAAPDGGGGGGGAPAAQPTGGGSTGGGGGSTGSGGGGSATGATGGGSTGTTASTGSDSSDEFDLEDCPELQGFVDSAGVGSAFAGGGVPGVDFDPEDFQRLAENAPGEIREDMQLVADALEEFFTVLEDLEIDFSNPASFANLSPADLAKFEEVSSKIDTPELEAASDRIEAYFDELCS